MVMKYFLFSFLFFVIVGGGVYAQSSSTTPAQSTQFDTTGFPIWAKDLRRAEIVAFGSFPFTVFFAAFVVDSYRFANNNWDRRYAPWPFDSAGAVDRTEDEQIIMLSVAAVSSLVIALVDFFIVRYKRQKQLEYINSISGTPIIIRKPWPEEKQENPSSEAGSGAP